MGSNPTTPTNRPSRSGPATWLTRAIVLLLVVGGVGLRLWRAGELSVLEDEIHGLRLAHRFATGELLRTFPLAGGYSLQALYAQLLEATIGLDEWRMRLPALLAGCATVLLAAALALRWLPGFQACALLGLVSLSPYLVYLSQTARVYAVLGFTYAVAVWQTFRWLGGGPDRSLLWAAGCAALTTLLHPSTLPAVAVLAVTPVLASAVRGRMRERWRGLAVGSLAFALGVAASLGVQVHTLLGQGRLLGGLGAADAASVPGAMRVALGLPFELPAWVWAGLVLLGAGRLARSHPLAAGWFVATLVAQIGEILYVQPVGAEVCWIFLRYAAHLLPFVFAALVLAVFPPLGWLAAPRRQTLAVAAVGLCALAYAASQGTAGRYSFAPPAYAAIHPLWMFVPVDLPEQARALLPPFYTEVLPGLPEGALIEAPFVASFPLYGIYQRLHRREVYTGALGRKMPQGIFRPRPGLELRRSVHLGAGGLPHDHPARYLVVHERLWEELPRIFRYFAAQPATRSLLRGYERNHTPSVLRSRFGEHTPPLGPDAPGEEAIVYRDRFVTVYDLARR